MTSFMQLDCFISAQLRYANIYLLHQLQMASAPILKHKIYFSISRSFKMPRIDKMHFAQNYIKKSILKTQKFGLRYFFERFCFFELWKVTNKLEPNTVWLAVAQLGERLLPIPEVRSSNPGIGIFFKISQNILSVNCWKDENKEKIGQEWTRIL